MRIQKFRRLSIKTARETAGETARGIVRTGLRLGQTTKSPQIAHAVNYLESKGQKLDLNGPKIGNLEA